MAVACLVAMSAVPANAADPSGISDDPTDGHLGSVGVDQQLPKDSVAVTAADLTLPDGQLALDSQVAVTDIVMDDDVRSINTVTWDKDTDVLTFFVYGDATEVAESIDQMLPSEQQWKIVPSVRPIADLELAIETLAATPGALPAGATFASGKPAPDGSSITVGIETASDRTLRAAPLPEAFEGIPVNFEREEMAISTTRARSTAPVMSGNYMTNNSTSCTTGFPVLRGQDSQYNMLTADHCATVQNQTWYFGGGSHSAGKSTFQAPGDTDLELFIEPASLSTWVLVGNHTDNSTVAPIRGYVAPVGGNGICYSGSRSGLVCNNAADSADTYSCIGFLTCYWTRWTNQAAGVPAAGNGDSGGPVIALGQRADGTIGAYGIGVVSMIPGGSPAVCTGDPGVAADGGRKCSPNVGFAPLGRWASSQSTHNLVYTTS